MLRPLLLLAALASGCAADPPASGAVRADRDAEADRLLAAVTADAVADAFARASPYRADVTVSVYDAHVVVGRETATVVQTADSTWIADRSASGVLAGGAPGQPRLRDPVASSLPQDPPYLDPAIREAYRISALGDTTIAGVSFERVGALLMDTERQLGVRRVWAAVGADGQIGAVQIDRVTASALYDETSRVRVDLAPGPDGWVPRRVVTDTRTDVPFSEPSHVKTVWQVREVAGQRIRRDG